MVLSQALFIISSLITKSSIGFSRLGKLPFTIFSSLGARCFNFAKVRVRVSLHVLLAIKTLFVSSRIRSYLLCVREICGHFRSEIEPPAQSLQM